MYRGGHVISVWAYPIYESDLPNVDIQLGTNPQVKHSPTLSGNRGELVAVYACAEIPNSDQIKFELMTREECERIKSKSGGAHSKAHPWNTDFEAMCLKSVIKKMSKTISKKQNAHADRLSFASVAAEDTGEGQTITLGSSDFQTITQDEEDDEGHNTISSEPSSSPSAIEADKANAPKINRSGRKSEELPEAGGEETDVTQGTQKSPRQRGRQAAA
jgi:recombination protein RecT